MRLPAAPRGTPLARREVLRLPLALAAVLGPFPSLPAHAISATTMSGKSKPELGMILVDEPKQTGASISAEAVLPGGKVAAISYQSKFPLVSGGYYDVETMASEGGDGAFVQIATAKGDLASLKKDFFLQTICSVTGRYGSYGAPTDAKVLADDKGSGTRMLDISFTVRSPSAAEIPLSPHDLPTTSPRSPHDLPRSAHDLPAISGRCSARAWPRSRAAPSSARRRLGLGLGLGLGSGSGLGLALGSGLGLGQR